MYWNTKLCDSQNIGKNSIHHTIIINLYYLYYNNI